MRNIVIIITFLFLHSNSFSQIDSTFKLIPDWKKGDIKRYEIKEYSSVEDENEKKVNNLTTKEVVIQVLDVTSTFLEIEWRVDKLTFSDTIDITNPLSGIVNSLDKNIAVRYRIDKDGNITKILNMDEISSIIKARIDTALVMFIKDNQIEKSKADMLTFQFSMMYASPEQIRSIVLNEIEMFHQVFGFTYTYDKLTIIPDNIFAPNANGQPSNNLEVRFSDFDMDTQVINLVGKLKSTDNNEKMREFIENGRSVKYFYEFKYPENWFISYKQTLNSSRGYMNVNSTIEFNLIEF